MTADKEAPAAVLLNGEGRCDKTKTADFIFLVVNAQQGLKVPKGD
jgi:hypothetical protein